MKAHQLQPETFSLLMDCEPITYGLRGKTRAIAAVSDPTSSSVNSQFLAGTCSVRAGNEVRFEFSNHLRSNFHPAGAPHRVRRQQ